MAETLRIIQDFAKEIKAQPDRYLGFDVDADALGGALNESIRLAEKKVLGLTVESSLKAKIQDDSCYVAGIISVDHPTLGHSEVDVKALKIGNSPQAGLLQVEKFDVIKNLSTRVEVAASIAGVSIDGEISRALRNPYQGMFNILSAELRKHRIEMTQLGLQFRGGKLGIGIAGRNL